MKLNIEVLHVFIYLNTYTHGYFLRKINK